MLNTQMAKCKILKWPSAKYPNAQYTNNAQMPNTLNDKTPHKCKYEQAAGSSWKQLSLKYQYSLSH